MTKFKIGDKVKSISDSSLGITIGNVYTVEQTYPSTIVFNDDDGDSRSREADKYELFKEEVKVGDIIKSTYGTSYDKFAVVLAVTEHIVIMTEFKTTLFNDARNTAQFQTAWKVCPHTPENVADFISRGDWEVYNPEAVKETVSEFTLEEVAEKMGVDVKELRIKD